MPIKCLEEKPLVSIIIPTFNCSKLIKEVVQEVLQQTYEKIEILIGDNSSNDDTFIIASELSRKDERIRVFRNVRNLGAIQNIQLLIFRAKGELVFIRSCGDSYSKNYISRMVEIHTRNPNCVLSLPKIEVSYGGVPLYFVYSQNTSKRFYQRFWYSLRHFPSVGFYGVYKKEYLLKSLPVLPSFGADLILVSTLALFGEFTFDSEACYKFETREKRNSLQQDINFFFGAKGFNDSCRPGFNMLKGRLFSNNTLDISKIEKVILNSLTCFAFSYELALKSIVGLLRLLGLDRKSFMTFWIKLYMLFFAPKGTNIGNDELFRKIEVAGKFGLRNVN